MIERSVAVILCAVAVSVYGNPAENPSELYQVGKVAYKRKDYEEAVKFFRKAAEQGDAKAQGFLGLMYAYGQGVSQDDVEAVKWFRESADHGNAWGQSNLGTMYANGQGVPQDYGEAVKWYRRAAEQGDAAGQSKIGRMYGLGNGVPQDYVLGYMWLDLAAVNPPPDIKEAVKYRDALEQLMTKEQIAEAQRLAREWKPKKQ